MHGAGDWRMGFSLGGSWSWELGGLVSNRAIPLFLFE